MPELCIITGGVCAGKTTLRREKYNIDYVNIDASDIFLELCKGEFLDFPSTYKKEMNKIGFNQTLKALQNKENIVIEIIGDNEDELLNLLDKVKSIDYETKIAFVYCDIEDAIHRNNNRETDDVSSYYTQEYHFKWIKDAIDNIKKNGR